MSGDPISYLGWWPQDSLAAGIKEDGGLEVRNVTSRTVTSGPHYRAVAVQSDGWLVAGDDNGWLELMSMSAEDTELTEIDRLRAHNAGLVSLRWTARDAELVALTEGGALQVHSTHAFDEPILHQGFSAIGVTAVAPQLDGSLVIALSDGSLRGHRLDGTTVFELPAGTVLDPKLASDPTGGFLTAEPDGRLRRWSTDGRQLSSVETRTIPLSLSVSTTAGVWAVLGADGTVVTGTTSELARWRWDNADPVAVELAPDGHAAAVISTAGLGIRAATGPDEAIQVAPHIIEGATCGAWSPDGRLFAIGNHEGDVDLRTSGSWELVHRLTASPDPIRCVAWSSNGRFIASGCAGGRLMVDEHLGLDEVTAWLRTRVRETISTEERDRYGIPPTLPGRDTSRSSS
jgi:WD40 repeat protein